MGLLDDYYSQGGLGPWGAFYPSPLQVGDGSGAVPMPAPRPAAANQPAQADAPDGYMAIGGYQMPQYGAPPSSSGAANGAPTVGAPDGWMTAPDAPGFGDRISAGLASIAHSKGLIPSMVNGVQAFASGARTDPDAVSDNLTVRALQARGASPADAQAALGNPAIMRALINQYYGAAPRPAAAGSARPPVAASGGDTDPPAQGGAPSAMPAVSATAPLTVPMRPQLQPPAARGGIGRRTW